MTDRERFVAFAHGNDLMRFASNAYESEKTRALIFEIAWQAWQEATKQAAADCISIERITLEDFENIMVNDSALMTDEEIKAELDAAGIDLGPALAKLKAMIEATKQAKGEGDEVSDC